MQRGLRCAALATGIALSVPALAQPIAAGGYYATIGFGKSVFRNPAQVWHGFPPVTQYGYGWVAMDTSNTWSLGIGKTYRWGSLEASYQDFGETKSYAGYPYDPGDPNLPVGCVYPCTAPQWVYHYGTAQGVTLSALPERKLGRNSALFARIGATLYRATFEYHIADTERFHDARSSIAVKWSPTYGISPAAGIGLRFGPVTIEATRRFSLEARHPEHGTGNFQRVDTVQISYRVPL